MLRLLRVIAATVVFALLLAFFVDFTGKLSFALANLADIQFVPALLGHSFLVVGIILVATWIFGRIYCSVVCPLGIWQDTVAWKSFWLSRLFSRKKKYRFSKAKRKTRLLFLFLFIAGLVGGFSLIPSLLDSYSIFGRSAAFVIAPVYEMGNNVLTWLALKSGSHRFYYVDWTRPFVPFFVSLAMVVLINLLAFLYGRTWCNVVCPVGTFLGFFSRFSLFKIQIDTEKCNHCGLCAMKCKAACIDSKEGTVDSSRCVDCFNCLGVCRKKAIHYCISVPKEDESDGSSEGKVVKSTEMTDERILGQYHNRRLLLALGAFFAVTVTPVTFLFGAPRGRRNGGKGENIGSASAGEESQLTYRQTPITPPGSRDIGHFGHHCTACQLCVSKCPSHVLQPAFLEYGLRGMFQPLMTFEKGFCNFDCTKCADVCPTQAITPINKEEKHLIQVGKVHFVKELCVVHTNGTNCGACSEHCPTQAVRMVPYRDSLTIPEIHPEYCVGCGGCEHICPVRPHQAIFVEGNVVHEDATPVPAGEKMEVQLDDFGF